MMYNYDNNPMNIENTSMDIIDKELEGTKFTDTEKLIVKRMIHSTGDFDYKNIIDIRNNFLDEALDALKNGAKIYTDTRMTMAGVNETSLKKLNCEIINHIKDDDVRELAKEKGTTRSYQAIDKTIGEDIAIYSVGNAPTALYRIIELIKEEKIHPKAVIGVPVGFVGAAESKEALREVGVAQISTVGNKGGSNVAASIINALLYILYRK